MFKVMSLVACCLLAPLPCASCLESLHALDVGLGVEKIVLLEMKKR